MKVDGVVKWIVIDHQASSLFNVIANGIFQKTTAGKEAWKSLINGSSLQINCNLEGFDIKKKNKRIGVAYINARIGIVANNQDDCKSCDSCIGFGITARGCGGSLDDGKVKISTCGNIALCNYYSNKDTSAFGYILVQ